MKRKLLTIIGAILFGITTIHAQNVSDLIISEVMAEPDSTGILDEYGRRTGWIEIFNKSQGTVNYGGCFLSDDRNNLKKSPITKSDSRTKLDLDRWSSSTRAETVVTERSTPTSK